MNFSEYVSNIGSVINYMISLIGTTLSSLMSNNIFKTLLYVIIVYFIIENFEKIIDFILNIFSRKVKAKDQKQNSNTDIE